MQPAKQEIMSANIEITRTETLSDNKYPLKKVTFNRRTTGGEQQTQESEVYDMGNAATILLYHVKNKTVILTRQFRIPTYLNGNPTGMLIEACAGKMDDESPEECVRRETEEETGYKAENIQKIFEVYMSAGSVTEMLHFFTGTYSDEKKVSEGGGLKDEQEDIEVLEIPFEKALAMIYNGEIKDAKTIMLLQYAQIHQIFDNGEP